MQIFEVKNDTAEILYACDEEKLYLFDFLFIEDEELTIVSQVTDISTTDNENENIATVKFYLSVDKNNRLTKYNGHTPHKNAEVGYLDAAEIIGLFRPKNNAIIWGDYIRNPELTVSTDLKFLSSGFCTICDKTEQAEAVVKILVSSLEKANTKTLILDFDGKYQNIKTANKAVYGKEYRIPLDSRALDYIFENDLEDCTPDVKVVIQNIILEIQKYIESVEKGFIPFEMFLQIIVSETKRTANTGLLAFCNKLLNYKYKKIFADRENQFSVIDNCDGSFKLDLSAVDEKFYPLLFSSVVSRLYKKFYVIADITDENVKSSTMRNLYEKQNVRLLPVISHESKYLNKIKSHCSNFAVFAPLEKVKSAEFDGDVVNKIRTDELVLYGENSLFVPLLVSVKKQLEKANCSDENTITEDDLDDLDSTNLELLEQIMKQDELEKDAVTLSEDDLNDLEELYHPEVFVQQKEEQETVMLVSEENDSKKPYPIIVEDNQIIEESDIVEEPQTVEVNEILEIEEDDENDEENGKDNEIPSEIAEPSEEIQKIEETEELSLEEQKQEISEEQKSAEEPIAAEEVLPEIVQEEQSSQQKQSVETPVQKTPPMIKVEQKEQNESFKIPLKPLPKANELPVYEPKDLSSNQADSIDYSEGMRVSHAKYGTGTVEKIIKYGKKTLCSIQFDTLGRRLLDPNITTIEKI